MSCPWPVSSPWGAPRSTGPHRGTDWRCAEATKLFAPWDGRVDYGYDSVYGCQVWLRSASSGDLMLAHTLRREAQNGARVQAGTLLALSGGRKGTRCAGNSTGPHVHVGWWRDGRWRDPTNLCERIFTSSQGGDDMTKDEVIAIVQQLFRGWPDDGNLGDNIDRLRVLGQAMRNLPGGGQELARHARNDGSFRHGAGDAGEVGEHVHRPAGVQR